MKIAMDADSDASRIEEFQRLREQAKKDILIMGIGMSGVSKDVETIEKLLGKGRNITFLIMNPDVLIESSQAAQDNLQKQFQETKIAIDDKEFSDFYATGSYRENIKTSIANLQSLVDRQKRRRDDGQGTWKEGRIQVFQYSYYVPLNVTISDIGESYFKLIVEFCLPFSITRIRAKLSRGKIKKLIETQTEALLKNAKLILESR